MKSVIICALAALIVNSAVTKAEAADASLAAEANAAYDKVWGGELGASYRIGFAGFHITPTIGAFIYKGDNDRYYRDTFSNGQSRCRDSTNGQFAKDSLCNNTAVDAYGRIEASYSLKVIEVGAGARYSTLSETVQPYGTIGVPMGPLFGLKANAGDGYYALGVTFNY